MHRWQRIFLTLIVCGLAGYLPVGSASLATSDEGFLDTLARDTWAYLHSDQATAHHLPYSWWSASLPGGDYANPAEIGLYALAWLANPLAPDYGQCSDRFSALAQAWIFLAIVNHENDFIGRYFYRDPGVLRAHVEMYGGAVYLPLMHNSVAIPDALSGISSS